MDTITTPTTPPLQSSDRSGPSWVIGAVFCVAVLGFGTVHPWPRMALALGAVCAGWYSLRASQIPVVGLYRWVACLGGLALLGSALPFIPVGSAVRGSLQPGVAEPVSAALSLVDAGMRPLALDPWNGLIEWSVWAGLWLLVWGVAAWLNRADRARQVVWVLLGTGVVLVGLAMVQRWDDAPSIYWVSGIPSRAREAFFGTYVNANHGGAMCAALVPLGICMAAVGPRRFRGCGLLCVLILSVGVVQAGSRGAALAWVAGSVFTVLLAAKPLIRNTGVVLVALSAVICWVMGPEEVLRLVSTVVSPETTSLIDAGYVDISTGRRALLSEVWALAKGVWVLGVGPAGFDDAYRMVKTTPSFNMTTHAHNELLQLWVEHGLAVLLLWTGVFASLVWIGLVGTRRWRLRPDRLWLIAGFMGSALTMGIFGLVDFPLRLGGHGVLVAVACGAILGLCQPLDNDAASGRPWFLMAWRWPVPLVAVVVVWGWQSADSPYGAAPRDVKQVELARLAVRNQPVHWAAVRSLAVDRVGVGDLKTAAHILEVGTRLYPSLPWAWRDQARVARRLGNEALARASWSRMLALDLPGKTDPLSLIREAVFGAGGDAPANLARAILPSRADRWRQTGRLFTQLDMRGDAESFFVHALQLDPEGVNHYATALLRWGRPSDALKVVGAEGGDCGRRSVRAQALLNLGRYEEAVDAFTATLARCGIRDWTVRSGLGRARLETGDERGVGLVERLLRERPGAHGLRRALIRYLSSESRAAETIAHLEHLVLAGIATMAELVAFEKASQGLPFRTDQLSENSE